MRKQVDTRVIVLSTRSDLDVVISTWVPGYVAQRTTEVDEFVAASAAECVPVLDLACARAGSWVADLADRDFRCPVVLVHARDDLESDLPGGVRVTSPATVSGLLAAFEEVRSLGGESRDGTVPGGGSGAADRTHRERPAEHAVPRHRAREERWGGQELTPRRSARRGLRARWSLWRRSRQRVLRDAVRHELKDDGSLAAAEASRERRSDAAAGGWWAASQPQQAPQTDLSAAGVDDGHSDADQLFGAHPRPPSLAPTPNGASASAAPVEPRRRRSQRSPGRRTEAPPR